MPSTSGASPTASQSPSTPRATEADSSSNPKNLPRQRFIKDIKPSSRQRIDCILEDARERKIAMGNSKGNEGDVSNGGARRRGEGEVDSDSQSPGGGRDGESSADEETNILRRSAATLNYQATSTGQPQRKTTRSQPSTQSIRRSGRTYDPNSNDGRSEEEVAGENQGWWARFISDYGSIELENKGSVARDHLALERTFLAWLRTSLAFASIGIAITQLFRLNTASAGSGGDDPYRQLRQMGKPLGATFLGISIVMLFIGFHRYFESQHWIIRGKFPASRGSVALVAAITFALMVTSLVVVVVVEPKAYEKR